MIERLHRRGVKIYGTDLHGTIRVTTDGKSFEITTERMPQGSPILDAAAWLEGCAPGQIDINPPGLRWKNSCKSSTLARPERRNSSPRGPSQALTISLRITGIGQGRLGDIKKQGLACVEPV